MTTIVYRDGTMVGDSAIFDRGTYCGEAVKVFKNDKGWLLGCCGAMGEMSKFRDWFLAGMEGPSPEVRNDQSEFLTVNPEGKVFWYGSTDTSVEYGGKFVAIGSGFQVAMGALAAGANAHEAAGIAARLDNHTRLPLHSVSLGLPE